MLKNQSFLQITPPIVLSAFAVTVLSLLGMDSWEHLSIALYLCLLLGAGSLLFKNQQENFPDKITYFCCALSAGVFLSYAMGIILFHYSLLNLLGLKVEPAVRISSIFFLVLALAGFTGRNAKVLRFCNYYPALSWCLLVALCVAIATHFGYYNNIEGLLLNEARGSEQSTIIPNWGVDYDFDPHIRDRTLAIYEQGFPPPPPEKFAHRGVQLLLLNYNLTFGSYDLEKIVHFMKAISLLCFFCIAYMTFNISHHIFNLSKPISCIVSISTLVFSPLKYPLFQLSPTYRGFFSASGTFYHNTTQLTQYSVAICGIYLVLQAVRFQRRTFALGCFLLSASFFLKPSMFTVFAPATLLLVPLYKDPFNKDKLVGYFSLISVPILWKAYAWLFPVVTPPLNPTYHFFEGYRMTLAGRFPEFIYENTLLLPISVFAFSFAAFLPGMGFALANFYRTIRTSSDPGELYRYLQGKIHYLLLILAFLLAHISSMILSGSGYQINFKWSAAATYVMSLPVLVVAIVKIKNNYWRRFSWALYALHIYTGLAYLFHYAYNSSLF
jgi:hypothetical protein